MEVKYSGMGGGAVAKRLIITAGSDNIWVSASGVRYISAHGLVLDMCAIG